MRLPVNQKSFTVNKITEQLKRTSGKQTFINNTSDGLKRKIS